MKIAPTLDNLTERMQRFLGIQQAQTFAMENATADAIARLTAQRGDVGRLLALWSGHHDAGSDLVAGYNATTHRPVLQALRRVLETSLVVARDQRGAARAFLPLAPELVSEKFAGTTYRELGRTIHDGLWAGDEFQGERELLKGIVQGWRHAHPLARLLAPLCTPRPLAKPGDRSNFRAALDQDHELRCWRDSVVRDDWRAWLVAAQAMSVDEQVESMTILIGLHLHLALLQRLAVERNGARIPVRMFLSIEPDEDNPVAARGSYGTFSFWRERAQDVFKLVGEEVVNEVAMSHEAFRAALGEPARWDAVRVWATLDLGRKQSSRREDFRENVIRGIEDAATGDRRVPRQVVVEAIIEVFGDEHGVVGKTKQYLRTTGMGAGIVGPVGRAARKRYLLDDRGLSLLARLHAARAAEGSSTRTNEDDKLSVAAFLDDLFMRYGMIVTDERECVQEARHRQSELERPIWRIMPNSDAMRRNREQFDRRLDALRLVRRYSDASAIVYVPGGGH